MRLAAILALAYMLAIVYASLQPFTGWRLPPDTLFAFVLVWPHYVTTSDIVINVIAYFPFGTLLFAIVRPTWGAAPAIAIATLAGIALSFAMESTQMFVPERIATTLDLISNGVGAGLGALAGWGGQRFARETRRYWLRDGLVGEIGLIVILLWLVIQMHPAPFTMGSGDLRDTFPLTRLISYTPRAYAWAEVGVTLLATIAIGLLVQSLLVAQRKPWLPIALVLFVGLAMKSLIAATLMRAAPWQQWITPGALLGLIGGGFALVLLTRLPGMGRAILGALCIVGGLLIVNSAPENPYQSPLPILLSTPSSHFANLVRLTHALSMLWPFLALAYLAWIIGFRGKSNQSYRL